MSQLQIIDGAVADPDAYRAAALGVEFRDYDFGHCIFRNIGVDGPAAGLLAVIRERFPDLQPTLTFFRKSPLGQVEPHLIHTDIDMGDWSALLYLNPAPPEGDGTAFWTHRTGAIASSVPHERSIEGHNTAGWVLRERVAGRFNRLLLFPSSYFHSRAIFENWGSGDDSRLVQVVFGKGTL